MLDADLGVFAPLIQAIPADLRPWAVSILGALLILVTLWSVVLKPFGELLVSCWRASAATVRWAWERLRRKPAPTEAQEPPEAIPEEKTIWERHPAANIIAPVPLTIGGGVPVLTVANMKGGVGKTTVVANLAAYMQSQFTKPILVIDFDYQGSLSEMLWRQSNRTLDLSDMRAHSLLTGRLNAADIKAHARMLAHGLEKVELFPARYPLATIENELMIDWAVGKAADDIRYRLSSVLHDPAFRSRYGAVLIDCPPRITTGTINALCASTHLLIPTKLDEMSAEAAVYFLQQITRMQGSLFPALKVMGVLPTMTQTAQGLADYEERGLERLQLVFERTRGWRNAIMLEQRIPQKADIARPAGVGVAYLRRPATRPIFERLGIEVLKRLS